MVTGSSTVPVVVIAPPVRLGGDDVSAARPELNDAAQVIDGECPGGVDQCVLVFGEQSGGALVECGGAEFGLAGAEGSVGESCRNQRRLGEAACEADGACCFGQRAAVSIRVPASRCPSGVGLDVAAVGCGVEGSEPFGFDAVEQSADLLRRCVVWCVVWRVVGRVPDEVLPHRGRRNPEGVTRHQGAAAAS